MLQPKKPVKKYVPTAKEKKNLEDASHNRNMRPPFTDEERKKMKNYSNMGKAKSGTMMKKAKSGTSLGMKSVKAGFDKNPGVTRADIITAAKGKAKSGAKMKMGGKVKKAQTGTVSKKFDRPADTKSSSPYPTSGVGGSNMPAKSGKSMKKCKYGCK